MKILAAALILMAIAGTCFADQAVDGYYRKDGTYVAPYVRSSPDTSYNNNYSTRGSTNPYTGETGSAPRTSNDRTPEYNIKSYGNPGYETPNSNSGRKSKSIYGY